MRMLGKAAIVTGAGSGIGRATALRLAAEGAAVAYVDLSIEAVRETAQTIKAARGQALALPADVTDDGACARMVANTLARFRNLTTLVNSAGSRPIAADPGPAPDEWRRVIEVNLTGTYLASRAALPALQATGAGSITNLAPIFGLVGGSMAPSYAASKRGVANLTRHHALNWAPAVRVNCVCPGAIETLMTAELRKDPAWRETVLLKCPLGRFGQPEEFAVTILYLTSDDAASVTGGARPVDSGYTAI